VLEVLVSYLRFLMKWTMGSYETEGVKLKVERRILMDLPSSEPIQRKLVMQSVFH
jgi:hypothetical protein